MTHVIRGDKAYIQADPVPSPETQREENLNEMSKMQSGRNIFL